MFCLERKRSFAFEGLSTPGSVYGALPRSPPLRPAIAQGSPAWSPLAADAAGRGRSEPWRAESLKSKAPLKRRAKPIDYVAAMDAIDCQGITKRYPPRKGGGYVCVSGCVSGVSVAGRWCGARGGAGEGRLVIRGWRRCRGGLCLRWLRAWRHRRWRRSSPCRRNPSG